MNMENITVLTAAPTVWSSTVLMMVFFTFSLGSTRAGALSKALSSLRAAAAMASLVGAGWVEGKVASRKSCLGLVSVGETLWYMGGRALPEEVGWCADHSEEEELEDRDPVDGERRLHHGQYERPWTRGSGQIDCALTFFC